MLLSSKQNDCLKSKRNHSRHHVTSGATFPNNTMNNHISPPFTRIDVICPLQFIKEHHFADYWPPIPIYVELIKIAAVRLRISEDEVRHRYWDASIKTWCQILQLSID